MAEIRRARPDEVPRLAAMLADAFADDVIMRWTSPATDRREHVRAFFDAFDRLPCERGWLWCAEDGAGAALWVPPGTHDEFDGITFALEEVRSLPADVRARYDSFWSWAEGRRPAEPHWYLDHLAVHPRRRGRGLGGALVEHGLALARADGAPAFLCTSRPGNVAFYERRGFSVTFEGEAPAGGPRVWFLLARP